MSESRAGRTAVVLGGTQGIGRQLVKSLAGLGAYGQNAGMVSVKKGPLEEYSYCGADLFEPAWADRVNLGDHGKSAADSQQAADGEMLFGLRLDAFFG